jgi:putative tryptophan/tyrosine transport system substrate-binding protein
MGQATRRRCLAAIAALLATPSVNTQPSKGPYRIAIPFVAPRASITSLATAFEEGLQAEGLVVGRDVLVDYRSAEGRFDRLSEIVRDVVKGNPDVIVTALNQVTLALAAMTRTIPIVMVAGTDVIKAGLVTSLARPGGNVTGLTWDVGPEVSAKRLQLLRSAMPSMRRLAIIWAPPYGTEFVEPDMAAAKVLGLTAMSLGVDDNFDAMFAMLAREHIDAASVYPGGQVYGRRDEFATLAAMHHIATAFPIEEMVASGGLMSYGPNLPDLFRRGAGYVKKILMGAQPGDLPVQQPTRLDLVINVKTAKALGITIPKDLLLLADRVVQ